MSIDQEEMTKRVHSFKGEPDGDCQMEISPGWFCLKPADAKVHLKEVRGRVPVPTLPEQFRAHAVPMTPPEYLKANESGSYQTYTGNLTVDDPATTMQGALVFFDKCVGLICEKNVAYKDAWKSQGWSGNVSRILSKAKRVENMLWTDKPTLEAGGESVVETLKDLANLCYFAARNIEEGNRWGK